MGAGIEEKLSKGFPMGYDPLPQLTSVAEKLPVLSKDLRLAMGRSASAQVIGRSAMLETSAHPVLGIFKAGRQLLAIPRLSSSASSAAALRRAAMKRASSQAARARVYCLLSLLPL